MIVLSFLGSPFRPFYSTTIFSNRFSIVLCLNDIFTNLRCTQSVGWSCLTGILLLTASPAVADRLGTTQVRSPLEIAQVSPLYGCWQITFRNEGGVVHQGALVMNGYSGVMTVSYWSVVNRRQEYVDQTMTLMNSAQGILIAGSNPVWSGTRIRMRDYSPDNFLFSILPDGTFFAATCDDRLVCSPVEIASCRQ
jgi:hypothetical protein